MSVSKLQYGVGNAASTTTSASMTNSDTATPLTSSTNFQAATVAGEGMILIDEGAATEELAYSTGISGGSLTTPLVNRGLEGGSASAHSAGVSVKGILTVGMWNNLMDALINTLFTQSTGALKSGIAMTSAVLTTPKITTSINDSAGNEILRTPATASAVNDLTITNAATGSAPLLSATGDDSNIELKIASKGTKQINLSTGHYQGFQAYTPAGGATATLDLSLGNDHRITMPAGNAVIALSNEQIGQKFLVSITQDSVGSRTVTWFTTIKWAGGSAPTLTTTANKRDTLGLVVTASGTYDGFVVGQNI